VAENLKWMGCPRLKK